MVAALLPYVNRSHQFTDSRSVSAQSANTASSHEHEFLPIDEEQPIFEDGAAIFHQQCEHVEIRGSQYSAKHDERFYDEGPQCDETRTIRLELVELEFNECDDAPILRDGDHLTITFDECVNDYFRDAEEINEGIEAAVMEVEKAAYEGEADILEIEPESRVVVEHNGIKAVYER